VSTVLRGIFSPETNKITEGWRKVHNGELHNFYLVPNIIRTGKSRRMGLTGHLACVGEECI
jgi:hypothetical protein